MSKINFTPTVTLSPDDYLFASCADPKRTDFRVAPVLPTVPTNTNRKPSSYTERTKRFFALADNDAVARTLEAR
jgi:hypothetical protein